MRQQYLASATGDMDLWRSVVAADVEWTESAGFPPAGTYRTPEGTVDGVFTRLADEWDDWTTHDDTYVHVTVTVGRGARPVRRGSRCRPVAAAH
ncbi:hypothetical protein [Streptacidiphilus cavernicola]|uniref:SnoaL-like domain-containing protein n=1 Tax=Streptacidiphilus cavernicola TaxID=3342716 RepID=A0ABV6VQ61_9ACTN